MDDDKIIDGLYVVLSSERIDPVFPDNPNPFVLRAFDLMVGAGTISEELLASRIGEHEPMLSASDRFNVAKEALRLRVECPAYFEEDGKCSVGRKRRRRRGKRGVPACCNTA